MNKYSDNFITYNEKSIIKSNHNIIEHLDPSNEDSSVTPIESQPSDSNEVPSDSNEEDDNEDYTNIRLFQGFW